MRKIQMASFLLVIFSIIYIFYGCSNILTDIQISNATNGSSSSSGDLANTTITNYYSDGISNYCVINSTNIINTNYILLTNYHTINDGIITNWDSSNRLIICEWVNITNLYTNSILINNEFHNYQFTNYSTNSYVIYALVYSSFDVINTTNVLGTNYLSNYTYIDVTMINPSNWIISNWIVSNYMIELKRQITSNYYSNLALICSTVNNYYLTNSFCISNFQSFINSNITTYKITNTLETNHLNEVTNSKYTSIDSTNWLMSNWILSNCTITHECQIVSNSYTNNILISSHVDYSYYTNSITLSNLLSYYYTNNLIHLGCIAEYLFSDGATIDPFFPDTFSNNTAQVSPWPDGYLVTDRFGITSHCCLMNFRHDMNQAIIGVPSLKNIPFKNVSYSLWIYPIYLDIDDDEHIIGRDKASSNATGSIKIFDYTRYGFMYPGKPRQITYFTGANTYDAGYVPTVSNWIHIVLTIDSNNLISFYINGTNTTNVTCNENSTLTNYPLFFGNRWNKDHGFQGKIDDIRIYNRVITSNQIIYLLNEPN